MKHIYSLLWCLLILGFSACNEDELEATVPAYLKIEDIEVQTTSPEEGSSNDDIVDAWVFVNNQLIGAYELPTTIPILNTGPVKVQVRGGVLNNGLSNQRELYPFYDFFEWNTVLSPEGVYQPKITVGYMPETKFNQAWSGEDFESGINFIRSPNSDTNIVRTNDPAKVFEGIASGRAFMPTGTQFFEVHTPFFTNIPRNGTPVYMELNYRSTHNFAISVYTNNRQQQFSVINFRASGSWNKVYVDFSKVFSTLFDAFNYSIAIGFSKPQNENAELLLDNIKLMHF